MTKFLIILAWPTANIKSSEFNEKIGNVLILQAFNDEEAKKKALKLLGKNQDVKKYLKVYNLEKIIDSWMYFRRG